MAVRTFDGVDDAIIMLPGTAQSMAAAPFTFAVLFDRDESEAGAVDPLLTFVANATTTSNGFISGVCSFNVDNNTNGNTMEVYIGASNTNSIATTTILNADGWVLAVVTKASGTVAPRFHRYRLTAADIVRANGGTAVANGTTPTSSFRFEVGKDDIFNDAQLHLAVAACWDVALTDGQVDELYANLATADWYNNSGGTPVALWEFNQASTATAVTDLTGGGADQTAIAGTTVNTTNDPPGWTFGLEAEWPPEGAENAPETLRVVQPALRLN
jgi:hypothetical protein